MRNQTAISAYRSMQKYHNTPNRFDHFLLSIFFLSIFLQASYVGIAPIALLSFPFLILLWLRRGIVLSEAMILIVFVLYVLLFIILSVERGWYLIETLKSGLGSFLFLGTTVILPLILIWVGRKGLTPAKLAFFVFSAAFLLDIAGAVPFKEIGLVRGYGGELFFIEQGQRASGLSGEPSWFSLTLLTLTRYIMIYEHKSLLYLVVMAVLIFLSGSSTGIAGVGVLGLIWWFEFGSSIYQPYAPHSGFKLQRPSLLFAIKVTMFNVLFFGISYVLIRRSDAEVVYKLISPLEFGSGINRFLAPIEFVAQTLELHPLTGFGYSYFGEQLFGLTAAAMLPLPIFWETGLIGITVYYSLFGYLIYRYHPSLMDFVLFIIVNVSLGQAYSPFQAIMIIVPLMSRYLRVTNRDGHA